MATVGSLREAAEAVHAGLTVFTEAVRVVHGPDDVGAKCDWTIEVAKAMSGASSAAIVRREEGEYVVVAGDTTFEDRLVDLDDVLAAVMDGEGSTRGAGDLVAPSLVALPVRGGAGPHAALVLAGDDPDAFDDVAIDSAAALATNLGVALDNLAAAARLAELELARREVVHQLQAAVRPAIPVVPDTGLGVYYLAADPQEPTGGDLYDWHVLPDGTLFLAVIDIVGKGVSATKDAVALAHVLRVLVLQGSPLGKIVREADDLVGPPHPELAATVVVALFDPTTGLLQVASGGHPPVLIVRADGTTEYLELAGAPLGFPNAGSHEVATVTLGRSDSAIFYTDGVVEARKDIVAGFDELAAAAALTRRYPARQQARALVERALAGAARRDDSLVLVLRRRIPPGEGTTPFRPFEHTFSPHQAAVGLVRHFLADWLRFQHVTDADAEDPVLIVSELAANAVAASTEDRHPITARAWAEGTALVIEVEGQGDAAITLCEPPVDEPPDLEAESGRGLFVVRALSDRVEVLDREGATVVRSVCEGFFP